MRSATHDSSSLARPPARASARAGADAPSAPGSAQTVATLRADDELDGVFACTRKERQISRAGSPYLTVELRDSTGAILGRAFRDADLLAGRFQRGELVRVRGRVQRFRDQLQVELRSIASAHDGPAADPERFLPTAYRDRDELEGFLEHLAREVYDPGLQALLTALLADPRLREQIRMAPCSLPAGGAGGTGGTGGAGGVAGGSGAARSARSQSSHHAYLGGLLEHTVAVATIALELCTLHPRLDRDLLLAGAIVHDLGKTREFSYGAEIRRSREGRLLGHIQLGLRVIAEHAPATLEGERRLALEHCVMLHHGPDGACGQRFASAEALALYRLNALDAQVKGALEHGGGALAA
ncbi:MAG TPA: HD domain-containing protein [Solirubrobacteraceae bacterium]|nr:HD domain-containing protein [Solirubrobacteraceae bacterium]